MKNGDGTINIGIFTNNVVNILLIMVNMMVIIWLMMVNNHDWLVVEPPTRLKNHGVRQ
jgi:hypothetical protein